MSKKISSKTISTIRILRSKGWSLPELKKNFPDIGYGSIFRYTKNIEILPQYQQLWAIKRKGSIKRMQIAENKAQQKASKLIKKSFPQRKTALSFSFVLG